MPDTSTDTYLIHSPIKQIVTGNIPTAAGLTDGGQIGIGKVVQNATSLVERLAIYGRVQNNIYNFLSYDCQEAVGTRTYNDLGGLPAGTTKEDLNGKPISEILDLLIFPEIEPTFVAPSISISFNGIATIQEVGTTGNTVPSGPSNFKLTWDPGSIYIVDTRQNDRAGAVNSSTIEYRFGSGSWSSILTTTIQEGNNQYRYTVSYDDGPHPLTSKGNPFGTPLEAGTLSSSAISIYGVFPYFANTQNEDQLTKLPLTNNSNFICDCVSESAGSGRHKFALPAKYNVTKIEYFDTVSQVYNPMNMSLFTKSTYQQEVQGNNIEYARYDRNESALSGATRFRITFTKS